VPEIELLDRVWYANTLRQWLIALALLGGLFVGLSLLRRVLVLRLGALAARSATRVDDVGVDLVRRTRAYFLFAVALYAASRVLVLTDQARGVIQLLMVVVVLLQAGRWGTGLIGFAVEQYLRRAGESDSGTRATVQAVGYAGRFALWAVLLVMALSAFGIDVTALITGLGIGGIAIALAVQNILGDLFASLSIAVDKPFEVGDAIGVGAVSGSVEYVGLKTTRIRALGGEQVIMANADLLKQTVSNFKRQATRRVVLTFGVSYDTTPDQVEAIPGIVRAIIEPEPQVRFDRAHFKGFGEIALNFEVVYIVLVADFMLHMDLQQRFNLQLMRELENIGVSFAHPTRTVRLAGGDTVMPARA
jgi:small-conductance mechanosensitive channel